MDFKTQNDKLQAQMKDLEAELTAVKQQRDDFRKDLARYRKKVEELTSTAEEQHIKQKDMEWQLERLQKGSVGRTVKQNIAEPAIVLKQEITSEDSDIEIIDAPASSSKLQKRLISLEPSPSTRKKSNTTVGAPSTAMTGPSPPRASPAIPLPSSSNVSAPSHNSTPSNRPTFRQEKALGTQKAHAPTGQNVTPTHEEDEEAPPASEPQLELITTEQVFHVVQPPSKRRSPDEDVVQPNAKRAKTSVPQTSGPGPSRRKSTRNKGSEAAQIGAHIPKISRKGKEKASDGVSMQIVPLITGDHSLHAELQNTSCNKYKSDKFQKCAPCTCKPRTDSCLFQGIRFFLRDAQKKVVGVSFSKPQKADLSSMKFPKRWNEPLTQTNIKRTKITVARALLPTLHQELKHLRDPQIIRWPREHEVRVTCDTCMTSIFSSSWLCRTCGREVCAECYATISELAAERLSADQALQAKRKKRADHNSILLQCNTKDQAEHQARDFSPVSRFEDKELSNAIKEMEELLKEEGVEQEAGVHPTGSQSVVQNGASSSSSSSSSSQDRTTGSVPSGPSQSISTPDAGSVHTQLPEGCPPYITTKPFIPGNLSRLALRTPTRPIRRFADSALTQEKFPLIWALGEPLVVTDLLHKFRIEWTPGYFITRYGQKGCEVIECEAEREKCITMGEFFAEFGQYKNRKESWELKDLLPESTPFKKEFPELYKDLSNALPVPSYVRSDGVLNIASHFPAGTVAPDLGPRMNCTMTTTQAAGSKGSLLRVEMVDVVEIMTYTSPAPDGSSGCAVWDIYHTEDNEKIRAFLTKQKVRTRASKEPMEDGDTGAKDPIHERLFYLDEKLRAELHNETGVESYRFYQRPGDAVFIPAGCAHQVASLADCVTVCMDFVTPESVKRCERQTREFREQKQHEAWNEDRLQLRIMMWFAWLSCRQLEGLR